MNKVASKMAQNSWPCMAFWNKDLFCVSLQFYVVWDSNGKPKKQRGLLICFKKNKKKNRKLLAVIDRVQALPISNLYYIFLVVQTAITGINVFKSDASVGKLMVERWDDDRVEVTPRFKIFEKIMPALVGEGGALESVVVVGQADLDVRQSAFVVVKDTISVSVFPNVTT